MNGIFVAFLLLAVVGCATSENCTVNSVECHHELCTNGAKLACVDNVCTCYHVIERCESNRECREHHRGEDCAHSAWICYRNHACHCYHFGRK